MFVHVRILFDYSCFEIYGNSLFLFSQMLCNAGMYAAVTDRNNVMLFRIVALISRILICVMCVLCL